MGKKVSMSGGSSNPPPSYIPALTMTPELNFQLAKKFEETMVAGQPKQRRNDSCACGSGKKYKRCCIKRDRENG